MTNGSDMPFDGKETAKANDSVDLEQWFNDLSYKEVHLFTEGAFRGFTRQSPRFNRKLQGTVMANSWYAKGGYILAYLVKSLLLIIMALVGANAVGL